MTGPERFEQVVSDAVARLGPAWSRALADRIAEGAPRAAVVAAVPVPGFPETAATVLATQEQCRISDVQAAAYLRGAALGYARHAGTVQVETVWTGPATHRVPVRATAQVLAEVVAEASAEVLLMTYSARPYPPLLDALGAATARGVAVSVVVETLQGAGSALAGAEPAAAFASVAGVELWHWPVAQRTETGAKLHAKLAVADRRVLLVSSANLTQPGVAKNIEAGLLVRGGTAPQRAAEHIAELQSRGVLVRLSGGVR